MKNRKLGRSAIVHTYTFRKRGGTTMMRENWPITLSPRLLSEALRTLVRGLGAGLDLGKTRRGLACFSLDLFYPCLLDDTRPKGLLAFDYFGEFRRGVSEGHVSEIDHTRTHLRRVHDFHCFAIESFDNEWRGLGRYEQTKPDSHIKAVESGFFHRWNVGGKRGARSRCHCERANFLLSHQRKKWPRGAKGHRNPPAHHVGSNGRWTPIRHILNINACRVFE